MIMSYSKHRLKEVVTLQRRILDRIEADLGEFGASTRLKYIQEFTDEFRDYEDVCSVEEILTSARSANVVWIGDYHAFGRSRDFAIDFLRRLAARTNNQISLAVEIVFARHQKILDRWLNGQISESEFLETIRYSDDWDCDWPSYKRLFEAAKEIGIPIHAIDCHPRRDLRSIRRRDQSVARRVANIFQQDESRTIVVLFGESHLASTHLPGRVQSFFETNNRLYRDVVILQNTDEIYWRVQESGRERVEAVRIEPGRYCVFNATPLEKYESFRQYLQECAGDPDTAADWSGFVYTLIDGMVEFLDVPRQPSLVDYLPKVYSEISAKQLPEFLSHQDVHARSVPLLIDQLQERGTSYIPELNSMFIDHFSLDSAVEETARFIYRACSGTLKNSTSLGRDDAFFRTVMERALGYFCSKLIDSSRDGIEALGDRVLSQIGYNDDFARTIPYFLEVGKNPSLEDFEKLQKTIEQFASRRKLIGMMAHMLGYALGRRLHRAYLESRISRKEIQALFHDPLAGPNDALFRYVELSTRLA